MLTPQQSNYWGPLHARLLGPRKVAIGTLETQITASYGEDTYRRWSR